MAQIWRQPYPPSRSRVCEDRPVLQRLSDGVCLELTGTDAVWIIELSRDDCERIAEAIGFSRPGVMPWGPEE